MSLIEEINALHGDAYARAKGDREVGMAILANQLAALRRVLAVYADPDTWDHVRADGRGSAWIKLNGHPTPWVDAQEALS